MTGGDAPGTYALQLHVIPVLLLLVLLLLEGGDFGTQLLGARAFARLPSACALGGGILLHDRAAKAVSRRTGGHHRLAALERRARSGY
jgi:hypothetical protein